MKEFVVFLIFLTGYECLSFRFSGMERIRFEVAQDTAPSTTSKPSANICLNREGYIPHETNCSLFYSCETNIAKNGSCPPSMWFDPNHVGEVLCNFPEVVCAADNSVCDCATLYPPPPPDPLIEPSITCLRDNKFHLFPSFVSCSRYFMCHNEQIFRMECLAGFHYNNITKQCDYPDEVNCKMTDRDCPLDGVKFIPHPDRCDGFLFCIHGYKTEQTCPFYHYWDQANTSCRKQDEVTCHLDQ